MGSKDGEMKLAHGTTEKWRTRTSARFIDRTGAYIKAKRADGCRI